MPEDIGKALGRATLNAGTPEATIYTCPANIVCTLRSWGAVENPLTVGDMYAYMGNGNETDWYYRVYIYGGSGAYFELMPSGIWGYDYYAGYSYWYEGPRNISNSKQIVILVPGDYIKARFNIGLTVDVWAYGIEGNL